MVATILEYQGMPARRAPVAPRADRDAGLVQGLRSGEADAADRLVTTYQSRAYRLALGITRNAQDAEEVVQDAFWSVLGKIARFRGDSTFGSWLYRIVANGACQKVRRRPWQHLDIPLDDVLPVLDGDGRHGATRADWSSSVDDVSDDTELRFALNAAIDELPAHHRVAGLVTGRVSIVTTALVTDHARVLLQVPAGSEPGGSRSRRGEWGDARMLPAVRPRDGPRLGRYVDRDRPRAPSLWERSMTLWIVIAVTIGGSNLMLAGVLAVSGRQSRQEEELARDAAGRHAA